MSRPALPTPDEIAKLPPDGGPRWNRLVFEKSPYLQQHAANPVDWWPWGEAAFEEARRRDVPVFLSIGYATCHWCHVMERESFEDEHVAQLMNDAFVCVKVDREERPDVDHVYMTVTQALTGSGGWPMTVALTADRKPFFAGTYFPKDARHGRAGMLQLVPALSEAWRERRDAVVRDADDITRSLAHMAAPPPGAANGSGGRELGEEVLRAAAEELAARFDPLHGGFGRAPKFPTPHQLSFLLRRHRATGDDLAREVALSTLRAMRRGGVYDQVGFGIHRYATDREWLVPHFEKMLYDQALLLIACADAQLATGDAQYGAVAREVADYVLRDLASPDGGFYCAEDADSEGEEGRFYVWTLAELRETLGEVDARIVAAVLGATSEGNYRDEATRARTGANVLHLPRALPEAAQELGMDEAVLREKLDAARAKLFAARERRERPLRDEKVLSDWNGLMIAALAIGGRALGDARMVAAAGRAADFVLRELRGADGRLLKRWRDGEAALPAVLDDHAFMAWGLVELYQATFETRRIDEALAIVRDMRAHFADPAGGFFLTADDGEPLPVRAKEAYDGAIPSGCSVAALALLKLARLTGEPELEDVARGTLRAFAPVVRQHPSAHAVMLMAAELALGPSHEVVIAGDPAAADTQAMLSALRSRFLPNAVVLLRPPGDQPDLGRLAPFTRDQTAKDGRATAYVCREHTCHAPTTDVAEMLALLGASGVENGVRPHFSRDTP